MADKKKIKERKYNKDKTIEALYGSNKNNKLATLSTYDGLTTANELFDDTEFYDQQPFSHIINNQSYLSKSENIDKRTEVLELAKNPEIDEILDILLNELLVFEEDSNYFCRPNTSNIELLDITDGAKNLLKDEFTDAFEKIYSLLNFDSSIITGVDDIRKTMKKWLALGSVAWYIVYDDIENPTKIIDIKQLDLMRGDLVKSFKRIKLDNGDYEKVLYWQYVDNGSSALDEQQYGTMIPRQQTFEPILIMDSQLIYVNWADTNISDEMSYASRFFRSFNRYRTVEKTHLSWHVLNSRETRLYTVPVKGKSKIKAEQTLQGTINAFKERYVYDDATGETTINGRSDFQSLREIWTNETHSGSIQVDNIAGSTLDLSDTSIINFYRNQMFRDSKIPLSRTEEGSQSMFNNDTMSITREEQRFSEYIDNIRRVWLIVLLKPIWIEISLRNPDFGFSDLIYKSLSIKFGTNSQFAKKIKLENIKDTIGIIAELRETLMDVDEEGQESPYFALEFLIKEYSDLNEADLELNKELITKERERIYKIRANNKDNEDDF